MTAGLTEDDVTLVIDRLRCYGALEVDNAATPEEEAEGTRLCDIADHLELQQMELRLLEMQEDADSHGSGCAAGIVLCVGIIIFIAIALFLAWPR